MELTFATLLKMARDSILAPRAGAASVMALDLPPKVGWWALMLMAVGSALLTHLSIAMMPAETQAYLGGAMSSPVRTAILQWIVMLLSVQAIHKIGRWRGGKGSLPDAVILVAWLQFILLCVQVVQLVAQVILPPFAEMLGLAGLVLFFWLLTNFIAELHGFRSLALTFIGVLITLFLGAFVLALVFALLFGAPAVRA